MQLVFVLAKKKGDWSSPRGSQWSFSSVDLEFRLLDYRQNTSNNILFRMCFYLGHVFSHVFQELKSCLRLVKVLTGEITRKNLCRIFKFVYSRVLLTFCVLSMLPQQEREPLSRFSLCSYLVWWFVYLICGRGKHHINRRIHNLTSIQLFWKHFLKLMHAGFTRHLIYIFFTWG